MNAHTAPRRSRWRTTCTALLSALLVAASVTTAAAVEPCTDDAREEDDTYQTATDWGTGSSGGGALCDDFDYVAVQAATGDTITATLQQVAADGDLDLVLGYADETGEDVITTTIPDPASDTEQIVHEVTWDDTYYVAVGSIDGASNEYTLTVSVAGAETRFDIDPTDRVATGTAFPAEELLTIEIDDPATVDDPDYGTPVVSEADGSFRLELVPEIPVGRTVRVRDGGGALLKDTTVAAVTLDGVDTAAGVVDGTADPDADVHVLITPNGSSDTLTVATTADGSGAWSANVAGTWTLQPGDEVRARQVDADGDGTLTPARAAPDVTSTDSASGHVEAGGSIETPAAGTHRETSAANPVYTRVTSPAAGDVTIEERETTTSPTASWYQFFGLEVAISAPPAPDGEHLTLEFRFDGSVIPQDTDPLHLRMFRNGELVPACFQEERDPCIVLTPSWDSRGDNGQWVVYVQTSRASTWNVGVEVPVDIDRLAGLGRVQTAAAISKDTFDSADTVVLARADLYPDALSGAPLAAKLGAPMLLTANDHLSDAARTEIERLGASKAVLLGGTTALSQQVDADLAAIGIADVARYSGSDRFDTARRVAMAVGGDEVYVTEGANAEPNRGWPDAVAVSALAAHQQHPILLVTRDVLPAATTRAIRDLGVRDATIVGGDVAVSDEVASAIDALDVVVDRVAGSDRFDTSKRVVERAVAAGASPRRVWLATGLNYPDALVAGPAAAADGGVLLLIHGDGLAGSAAGRTWLASVAAEFTRVVVVGGEQVIDGSVPTEVEAQVASARADAS